MKAADWVGVTVLAAALLGGGAYFVARRMHGGEGVKLPGGPQQQPAPVGLSVAPQDNTLRDVKAGVDLAKQGVGVLKDLWTTIESFGD